MNDVCSNHSENSTDMVSTPKSRKELKKWLLIAGGALVVLALVYVLLLCTAESRIYGTWEREVMFLPKYGCDCIMTVTFNEDGTAVRVLTAASSGEILDLEIGRWRMQGFEAQYVEQSESFSDGCSPYHFYPLTGRLKNNLWYKKIG